MILNVGFILVYGATCRRSKRINRCYTREWQGMKYPLQYSAQYSTGRCGILPRLFLGMLACFLRIFTHTSLSYREKHLISSCWKPPVLGTYRNRHVICLQKWLKVSASVNNLHIFFVVCHTDISWVCRNFSAIRIILLMDPVEESYFPFWPEISSMAFWTFVNGNRGGCNFSIPQYLLFEAKKTHFS